jgi:hypothetical protein
MNSRTSLPGLIMDVLRLSKVKDGERVAVVTTTAFDASTLDAYVTALEELGADAVRVILPRQGRDLRLVQPLGAHAASVLKQASLVVRPVTLAKPPVPDIFMYEEIFSEILQAGTRWLDVVITEEAMRRLFPDEALIERTMAGAELMERAQTIRITSEAGTDLRLGKSGRKGHKQTGIVDQPGMWDNFGFGLVACAPLEDSAEGTPYLSEWQDHEDRGLVRRGGAEPLAGAAGQRRRLPHCTCGLGDPPGGGVGRCGVHARRLGVVLWLRDDPLWRQHLQHPLPELRFGRRHAPAHHPLGRFSAQLQPLSGRRAHRGTGAHRPPAVQVGACDCGRDGPKQVVDDINEPPNPTPGIRGLRPVGEHLRSRPTNDPGRYSRGWTVRGAGFPGHWPGPPGRRPARPAFCR